MRGLKRGRSLGLEDGRDRPVVGCVGAQAVNGLGGEGHQTAGAQDLCCSRNGVIVSRDDVARRAAIPS